MKLRKYFVFIDDDENAIKLAVPATNEKEARDFAAGNGEIVAVKDVTESFEISSTKVWDALEKGDFTDLQRDFLYRTLYRTGIIEG